MKNVFILSLVVLMGWSCETKKVEKILFEDGAGAMEPDDDGESPVRYWHSDSFPIRLRYSEYFDDDFEEKHEDDDGNNPFEQTLLAWDEVSEQNFFTLPIKSVKNREYKTLEEYKDDEMGVYKHYRWFTKGRGIESFKDALAITQMFLRLRTGYVEINHADIIFNYRDYHFGLDFESRKHDLQSIMLHEVGHFLGLFHQFNPFVPSVMWPYLGENENKRELTAYDEESIVDIYDVWLGGVHAPLIDDDEEPYEGPFIRVIMALGPDGKCRHYRDGKLVEEHTHEH